MADLISNIFKKVDETPLPSTTALKILQLFNDPNHNIKDMYEIVNCDPVLSAECLKLVNSVSFGLNHQISSVDRATQYIGLLGLLQISMKHSNGPFLNQALPGYELIPGALWKESLFGACIAKKISPHMDKNMDANMAFTGALFRDLGKWIIGVFLDEKLEKAKQILSDGKSHNFLEVEQNCLGTNHCEVGGGLASKWKLPEIFKECVVYHHQPEKYSGKNPEIVWCVHFADALCRMQMPEELDGLEYPFQSEKLKEYITESSLLEQILFESKLEFDSLEAKFKN